MLTIPDNTNIYVYKNPVDMRKSFSGLVALTRNILQEDPLSGAVFVFFGKSRKIIKALSWDRTGYVIYAKKLENGTIKIFSEDEKISINIGQLSQLFDGISIGIKRKIS